MISRVFLVWAIIFIVFPFDIFIQGSWALMTSEEERQLGKKILLEMEKKVEFVRDLNLQTFINKIGYSLADQVGVTPFDYKFYLINSNDPNAFAIPGGHIFLNTGLITLAENESEVAGVISHEISHTTSRHVAQMIERSKRISIATIAAIIAGALLGGGGKATEAVTAGAMATAEALALKYTRENELEADQRSLPYMIKAGYDPNGLITFLHKIYKVSLTSGPKIPAYLSTHPAIEDRIPLLENLLQIGAIPAGPFKTIGDFKKIQAKAFVEEREPHVAVSHFESIVKMDQQNVDGIFGLGLAFKKVGRLDRSIEVFQTGLSFLPKDPDLLRELGIVYFLSGKLDQAIEVLEMIQSKREITGGQNVDLLGFYYLGRGYFGKGNFAKALPIFIKVQREVPEFIDVYNNLGSVYGRIGQKGLSHFYFGKYFKLRREKKNALLHFGTALEWLERGSPERGEAQREVRELSAVQ